MNLTILRTILALLITLSLAVAPLGSAWAAAQSHGSLSTAHQQRAVPMDHAAMSGESSADMSDCMKAMNAGAGTPEKSDCTCCDTKHKCPDTANCMTKCCKVIGAIKPVSKFIALSRIAYRQAEPAKPPEWLRTPAAPPPRT